MKRYKVKAECQKCGEEWTTKRKSDSKAPHQCNECGSTKTKTIHAYRVN